MGLDEQGKNHKVLCSTETLEHIQHAIDSTAEMLDTGLESLGWMIWHIGATESADGDSNLGIDSGQLASLGWLLMELTWARGVRHSMTTT